MSLVTDGSLSIQEPELDKENDLFRHVLQDFGCRLEFVRSKDGERVRFMSWMSKVSSAVVQSNSEACVNLLDLGPVIPGLCPVAQLPCGNFQCKLRALKGLLSNEACLYSVMSHASMLSLS